MREKYIWELMWPKIDDALYIAQPDQYRSEMYDRLATPLYPITFVIMAFTFLGPPQTTRQSRTLALLGMIGVIALLRLFGFISVIVGVRVPAVLSMQFVALIGLRACGPVADLARSGDRAFRHHDKPHRHRELAERAVRSGR